VIQNIDRVLSLKNMSMLGGLGEKVEKDFMTIAVEKR